jgi:hypothetical protein
MKSIIKKKWGHRQGEFIPKNKEKYKGSLPIRYRSSWEVKFMRYCDNNPSILRWGSESVVVKYSDPTRNGTTHKYYLDFNITVRDKWDKIHKYLIEVKPYKQTIAPVNSKRKKKETYMSECVTYARNQAKWKAASSAAKKRGMHFMILTERELYPKKEK